MTNNSHVAVNSPSREAFTLIEMLLVVAVIGILTSLVIAAVSNSAADARLVIARQQQATVQEALNAWISSTNISGARSAYSGKSAAQRLLLVSGYLDTNARWYKEYTVDGAGNIQTPNMKLTAPSPVSLTFEDWTSSNYPVVKLLE